MRCEWGGGCSREGCSGGGVQGVQSGGGGFKWWGGGLNKGANVRGIEGEQRGKR